VLWLDNGQALPPEEEIPEDHVESTIIWKERDSNFGAQLKAVNLRRGDIVARSL
jgi:hypothetical protein